MSVNRSGFARERGEREMALIIAAISLPVVIAFVGLSIDAGIAYTVRARLSAAMDSAALAAGRVSISATTCAQRKRPPSLPPPSSSMRTSHPGTCKQILIRATSVRASTSGNRFQTGMRTVILVISITGSVGIAQLLSRVFGVNSMTVSSHRYHDAQGHGDVHGFGAG